MNYKQFTFFNCKVGSDLDRMGHYVYFDQKINDWNTTNLTKPGELGPGVKVFRVESISFNFEDSFGINRNCYFRFLVASKIQCEGPFHLMDQEVHDIFKQDLKIPILIEQHDTISVQFGVANGCHIDLKNQLVTCILNGQALFEEI